MSTDTQVQREIRTLKASPLFDATWYVNRYRDVALMGIAPAEHYVRIGAKLLRDPGPEFSTAFYLASHKDVASAKINPLWHYIAHGRAEGRPIGRPDHHLQPAAPEFPVPLLAGLPPVDKPARVICFYLPQFHPIPENDAWWGEGFTEWTNVKPARPKFPRHYQPHEPVDPGYYDLRDTAVQRRQIELAKLYGIEGFCFYFYWFGGKRLLEKPIENYLADRSLDLPFCLCWANENWSRRWDGRDHDVLMAQNHSPEDDLAFIAQIGRFMRDPRYIRVDDKPLLLVYRPGLLPEPLATVARWRQWCREHGIGEIHIAYTQSFDSNDPAEFGFDAAIEFPPNNTSIPQVTRQVRAFAGFSGRLFDWSALVERSYGYASKPYTLYRGVCPSWDNTARRGDNGTILVNNSPARFAQWTSNAVRDAKSRFAKPDQRLVFVNAWNEWAEGAHLEPDRRFGYAWLESVRVALARNSDMPRIHPQSSRVAILVEPSDLDAFDATLALVSCLPERHKLFVAAGARLMAEVQRRLEACGRDFELAQRAAGDEMAFVRILPALLAQGFELVLRVPQPGMEQGGAPTWRSWLAGDFIEQSILRLASDHSLGALCRRPPAPVDPLHTSSHLVEVGTRLGLSPEATIEHQGWRGDAFLARVQVLGPLASLAFAPGQLRRPDANGDRFLSAFEQGVALSSLACAKRVDDAFSFVENAPSGKRRLVLVSHDAHPHGAQMLAMNMARAFGELGFEMDLVVLGPGPLLDRFREVATVHLLDPAQLASEKTLKLLQSLRANGAEAAIANTTVSGKLVPLLDQAGFRIVSLVHEMPGVLNGYQLQDAARAIVNYSGHQVFPAQVVLDGFESFVGTKLDKPRLRPQGLFMRNPHRSQADRLRVRKELRQRHDLPVNAKIILCVAYGDRRKGMDLFVDACIEVLRADATVYAIWVGHYEAPMFESVCELIRAAGLEHRFVFTGLVLDGLFDYYSASDVFALTSREDPFPSVVLDSLDAHVPVVAFSGVGGFEDVLQRGCGVLVPAFDTAAMAAAMLDLLKHRKHCQSLGDCGHDLVRNEFSFHHYLYDLAEMAGVPIPKVSVVVPNYNYARFIGERLRTITDQTSPIYELIVLDDASTDDSVARIEEFLEGCRIPYRFVPNRKNSGSVFKQWQAGVELARGDLVWIAEADDLCDPEFLQEVLPAFADDRVVMSYTQSRQMGSDGEILCENYLDYVADIDPQRWTKAYVAEGLEEISAALFVKNTIPNVSGVVFRRQALLDVLKTSHKEIFSYRNAGDWLVYLRVLEGGQIAFSPRSLNSHRRHTGSVTVGSFNMGQLKEIVRVQLDAIRRHKLGPASETRAYSYAQKLYEQFGLNSPDHPQFQSHPEIEPLFR